MLSVLFRAHRVVWLRCKTSASIGPNLNPGKASIGAFMRSHPSSKSRSAYCEAGIKENRMGHRRVVILPREPAPCHHLRVEHAARRAIAATPGRSRPVVSHHTVYAHGHALGRLVDLDQDIEI